MRKRIVIVLAWIALLGPGAGAQTRMNIRSVFALGEELRYVVRWKFLRLGTISVRTLPDSSDPTGEKVRVVMLVESNPAIPFVRIREYNESVVDTGSGQSFRYLGIHGSSEERRAVRHSYDSAMHRVTATLTDEQTGVLLQQNILENVDWYVEGTSLFFYARLASRSGKACDVPTIVQGAIHHTRLQYDRQSEDITIDAWDQAIPARRIQGTADWTGGTSAGLSGEFSGWISDDVAAIPLRAELQIILGTIEVELEHWQRVGWNPPSALHANNAR
jgi:hypothetical protein